MDEERRVGRAEALAALVAERQGQMVGYARKRLRCSGVPPSSAEARDVVQNALTSVLACPEPVEQLRPYVFAAIRNEVSQAARRYHRAGQAYGSLDADVRLEADEPAVDPCGAAELRVVVGAALTALPQQQRTAMLLHKELGLTQAETARAMGAAPGTVATHVSRAMVTLRVSLGALAVVVTVVTALRLGSTGALPSAPAAGGEAVRRLLFSPVGAAVGAIVGAVLGRVLWKPLLLRPVQRAASRIRDRWATGVSGSPVPHTQLEETMPEILEAGLIHGTP
ncbi:RNA polymerase sigma factor [Streptomyces sp. NPDC093094]|uniref:RNA polymerase sigma factor n=1 Tax=Streptomyces sp. NPDC093094 TaxID=3366026 RepID=UPI0037F34FA3